MTRRRVFAGLGASLLAGSACSPGAKPLVLFNPGGKGVIAAVAANEGSAKTWETGERTLFRAAQTVTG